MNPDDHAGARLKRRSERAPAAARDVGARAYGSERFLGVAGDGGGARTSVAAADGREFVRATSARSPSVPLPERQRGVSMPERAGAARENLLRAYISRSDMWSPRGSDHHGRHANAASPLGSTAREHSERGGSVMSTTSAAAVSMTTRRGTSSARSPRDINLLVDKLLSSVHGSPSAITTRRTVVRLHDSVGPVSIDSVRWSGGG